MAKVSDVAAYILDRLGEMTTWKLQKLVYYCQAWSLVWDERPLFDNRIEAWANGPVCPALYNRHRGQYSVTSIANADLAALTLDERETIDGVIKYYGKMDGQELSDLTHSERPWKDTRGELAPGVNCEREIPRALMAEYYGSLPPNT